MCGVAILKNGPSISITSLTGYISPGGYFSRNKAQGIGLISFSPVTLFSPGII
jgi:hypothetical protein